MLVVILSFLRYLVGRTFYDLYSPYFLPEVMLKFTRKVKGHFVTLIEVGMHLITCPPAHMQLKENFVQHDLKLWSEFTRSSFGIITLVQSF